MSNRIILLVTLEDTGEQTPPLDPPTADAVRQEIQSNLESVWPYANISVSLFPPSLTAASDIETHEMYRQFIPEPQLSVEDSEHDMAELVYERDCLAAQLGRAQNLAYRAHTLVNALITADGPHALWDMVCAGLGQPICELDATVKAIYR